MWTIYISDLGAYTSEPTPLLYYEILKENGM